MAKQSKPVIGKFVIENLTTGMYDNPNCVFREYIQNSADAIDRAVTLDIIKKSKGSIYIQINPEKREIEFEDNGTGIAQKEVGSVLLNVAQSDKEIGKEKGFRGIGRLGGLAYCDELVFETSFKGETVKSVLSWDAKKLKEIVTDRKTKEEASDVISTISKLSTEPETKDEHYFKVKLVNVTNFDLLNESAVKDYLRMVAPVSYDTHFIFRTRIYEEAKRAGVNIDEYNIYVNGDPVYKAHTTQLFDESGGKRNKIGEIKDVQFFEGRDSSDAMLFWGWHSVSNIQNVRLKKVNRARGLRLRKDNIQIGDEDRLAYLFRDSRFNFYVLGEVFAVHNDLVPNGRRDDFEDNKVFNQFRERLRPVCNDIQKISYETGLDCLAILKLSIYRFGKLDIQKGPERRIFNNVFALV